MKVNTLEDLFFEFLSELYNTDIQVEAALPKMELATASEILSESLCKHREKIHERRNRIEQIFETAGREIEKTERKGIKGFIEEWEDSIKNIDSPEIRDIALASGVQKLQHYEEAGYQSAHKLALQLGYRDSARQLSEFLKEEQETDREIAKEAGTELMEEAEEESGDKF